MRLDKRIYLAIGITAVLTIAITALLVNIFEHKKEARQTWFRVVEITGDTDDAAVWGKNFPLQYDAYVRTVDMTRTRYGGSEALPKNPTQADPRERVSQEKLEEDPRLKKMWAGYPFAADFREERGHAYMLIDQRFTKRVLEFKQPGACLNCHASAYVFMKTLGKGDIFAGFEQMNAMPYAEATKNVKHPVSCIDCHDPQTMALRITRPAFIEGIRAWKASQGIQNYDPNTMASAQEMRSFVCAQCHVEYYFAGDNKILTFPWERGLRIDDIEAYYDSYGFKDWTHAETGAPMIKIQHPEFELWSTGIHARSGVACADCHMPYMRDGSVKVSDHWLRSPLFNLQNSCGTCHKQSEDELKDRVLTIQGTTAGLLRRCRKGVFLGLSELGEQGYEQRGPLLWAFNQVLRQLATDAKHDQGHI